MIKGKFLLGHLDPEKQPVEKRSHGWKRCVLSKEQKEMMEVESLCCKGNGFQTCGEWGAGLEIERSRVRVLAGLPGVSGG